MRIIISFIFLHFTVAHAAVLELRADQATNAYRNTGRLILRDPDTDVVLFDLPFVTGGYGRGSAPFATYLIGAFRSRQDDDPLHIGPRWMVTGPGGTDEGQVFDARLDDTRTDIELHRVRSGGDGTQGCFGVLTDRDTWQQFVERLNALLLWQPVSIVFVAGAFQEVPVALAYAKAQRPRYKRAYYHPPAKSSNRVQHRYAKNNVRKFHRGPHYAGRARHRA